MSDRESERIDYWDCEDCMLSELDEREKKRHEQLTEHTIVPRYV